MTTPNLLGVDDEFGAGGIGLAPDGASGDSSSPQSPPFTVAKNARDLFRALLGALWAYGYANATAMTASLEVNRQDGQVVVKQDDYSLWIWKETSSAAAGTYVIRPTDRSAANGRWVSISNDLAASILANLAPATDSTAGTMSAADKTKLDAYAPAGILRGTAMLVAGQVTGIAAPNMSATSRIFVTRSAVNASTALGELDVTARTTGAGAVFTVTADTVGTPGTPLAADVSSFDWMVLL
jgi:hypothetical protein